MTLKKTLALLILLGAGISSSEAQTKLPVLKSNKSQLEIIADGVSNHGNWIISPSARPDVFSTHAKHVMFRSDVDSIAFDVKKDGIYDFVVLDSKNDSAFTQVRWESLNPFEQPSESLLKLSPSGKLSKEQAQFDIDALVHTLNEVHPDMFSVCGMDAFMSMANKIKIELPDSVNRIELYRYLAPLVSFIGDGHTRMLFPNNDLFTKESLRFPLQIDINTNDSTFTTKLDMFGIPKNARILTINGVDNKTMIEKMMPYASGERYFFKLIIINYQFPALFELFYNAPDYNIKYLLGGKIYTKKLKATTYDKIHAEINRNIDAQDNKSRVANYSYSIIQGNNAAVMDFRNLEDRAAMANFADSMIADLNAKHIGNLIIDIRNNGGGDSSVGDMLFKHISKVPFYQFDKSFARISPVTQSLLSSERCLKVGLYYNEEVEKIYPFSDKSRHYQGKVWLLISHHTFSSASSFSWAFQHFNMGKVIGEESGGMSVSFGDILIYQLPVSGLKNFISYKRFWLPGSDEKDIHGTIPDFKVPADKALDYTLELINK